MKTHRLIPCLLLKNGMLVRSQLFKVHQDIGNPVSTIMRFSNWNVDELILIDISKEDYHDLRRDDLYLNQMGSTFLDVIRTVSKVCFMPLSVGGRIRSIEDIKIRLTAGADKCIINTKALEDPLFIQEAANKFGSQCIIVSIDVKKKENGEYEVYSNSGTKPTGLDPAKWAKEAEKMGAGEIFLNSIDRDGSALGYDIELIKNVTSTTNIPVIACGGVGKYEDLPEGIIKGGADAVSAANIFHFFELSYPFAKKTCLETGISMRKIEFNNTLLSREPNYKQNECIERVLERKKPIDPKKYQNTKRNKMKWCTKCLCPSISAAPLEFDEKGVCSGCRVAEQKLKLSPEEWKRRKELLIKILTKYKNKDESNYDCIIPVSGGKDSYFQTHMIKNELGLNPLLVTYNGNNYTKEGWKNVHRMKEVFGVDHIFYSPSVDTLKKINRMGFFVMGDMNWHAHVGITTLPVRMAAQLKVPLLIWGEHGYTDQCGQFSMNDFPEMNYRDRLEHFARGYEWTYFVGTEGITSKEMIPYKYPSDEEIFKLNIRGIYLGNYMMWEANYHSKMVIEKYGFQVSEEGFDRTYRKMSNLDDMHENGVHDYLKYIKFGYGRCTDHVYKDIRAGIMTREEGIKLIKKMDHVKPRDLKRWLEYVEMNEEEFDRIANTFRDPRVWHLENGEWVKDNLWDEEWTQT